MSSPKNPTDFGKSYVHQQLDSQPNSLNKASSAPCPPFKAIFQEISREIDENDAKSATSSKMSSHLSNRSAASIQREDDLSQQFLNVNLSINSESQNLLKRDFLVKNDESLDYWRNRAMQLEAELCERDRRESKQADTDFDFIRSQNAQTSKVTENLRKLELKGTFLENSQNAPLLVNQVQVSDTRKLSSHLTSLTNPESKQDDIPRVSDLQFENALGVDRAIFGNEHKSDEFQQKSVNVMDSDRSFRGNESFTENSKFISKQNRSELIMGDSHGFSGKSQDFKFKMKGKPALQSDRFFTSRSSNQGIFSGQNYPKRRHFGKSVISSNLKSKTLEISENDDVHIQSSMVSDDFENLDFEIMDMVHIESTWNRKSSKSRNVQDDIRNVPNWSNSRYYGKRTVNIGDSQDAHSRSDDDDMKRPTKPPLSRRAKSSKFRNDDGKCQDFGHFDSNSRKPRSLTKANLRKWEMSKSDENRDFRFEVSRSPRKSYGQSSRGNDENRILGDVRGRHSGARSGGLLGSVVSGGDATDSGSHRRVSSGQIRSNDFYGFIAQAPSNRVSTAPSVVTAIGSPRVREGHNLKIFSNSAKNTAMMKMLPTIRHQIENIYRRHERQSTQEMSTTVMEIERQYQLMAQHTSNDMIKEKIVEQLVKKGLKMTSYSSEKPKPTMKWNGKGNFQEFLIKISTYNAQNGIRRESAAALQILLENLDTEYRKYYYSIINRLDTESYGFAALFLMSADEVDIEYVKKQFLAIKQRGNEAMEMYINRKMEKYDHYRDAVQLRKLLPNAKYVAIQMMPHQVVFRSMVSGLYSQKLRDDVNKDIAKGKIRYNVVELCDLLMSKAEENSRFLELSRGMDYRKMRKPRRKRKERNEADMNLRMTPHDADYMERKRKNYHDSRGRSYRGRGSRNYRDSRKEKDSKPSPRIEKGNKDEPKRRRTKQQDMERKKEPRPRGPVRGNGTRTGRGGRGGRGKAKSKGRLNVLSVNNANNSTGSFTHYIARPSSSHMAQSNVAAPSHVCTRKSTLHIIDDDGHVESKEVRVHHVGDDPDLKSGVSKVEVSKSRKLSTPLPTLSEVDEVKFSDEKLSSPLTNKSHDGDMLRHDGTQNDRKNCGNPKKRKSRARRRKRKSTPKPRSYYKRSAVVDAILAESKSAQDIVDGVHRHWAMKLEWLYDNVQAVIAMNVHPESMILAKMANSQNLTLKDFVKMDKLCKSARKPKFSGDRKALPVDDHVERYTKSKVGKRKKRNKIFVYKSLERVHWNYRHDVDPATVPKDDIIALNLSIDRQTTLCKQKALADTGATFNVITEDGIARLREIAGEPIHIRKGRTQYVENGSGEDVLYDGRYIELSVERPNDPGHFIMIRFDISPVPLSFSVILGGRTMKALGYVTVLMSRDMNEIYIHRRESLNFDVEADAPVYEMMDYFHGDTIADFRARQEIDGEEKDAAIDALIDGVDIDQEDAIKLDAYDIYDKLEDAEIPLDSIDSIYDEPADLVHERVERERNRLHVFEVTTQDDPGDDDHIEDEYTLESLLEFDDFYEETLKAKTLKEIRTIITDVWNDGWVQPKYIAELKRICLKYQHRIAVAKFDMGCINGFQYKINLKPGTNPIYSAPYNASKTEQDVIDETVETLLAAGVISEYTGPWGAPVLVVKNGDGSMRLCTDYSRRNKVTINDSYPCPNVNDVLPQFRNKSIFSTFDICKAFHNIKVAEEDRDKTAFVTKKGAYVWNVMPFGGKNCPATWARASDWVFRHLPDLVKYVDDIAIASVDEESHLKAFEAMMERITKYNLKLKLSKCSFFKREIKYVGHLVSHNKISPCKEYIEKVIKLKRPTKSGIGSFCGFVGWLSKYCFRLKQALEPISRLKKQNVEYVWGDEQERAFILCQQIIDSADILRMPDHTKPFYLWCDASEKAYGAVLMQRDEESDNEDDMVPVEFMSKVWQPSQVNWGMTTKEMAAMKEAVKKWDRYLLYNHFHVHVDAKNIEWLWKKLECRDKKGNPMHYRWLYTLKPYSFDVKHIPGVENIVADWLSRYNDFDMLAESIASNRYDVDYGYESSSDSDMPSGTEYLMREDSADMERVAQNNNQYPFRTEILEETARDSSDTQDVVSIIKEKERMERHRQSLMLVRHRDDDRRVELVAKSDLIEKNSIQRLCDKFEDDSKCEETDTFSVGDMNRGGGIPNQNGYNSQSPTTEELYRWHQELGAHRVHDQYARDFRNQKLFYVTARIHGHRHRDHARNRMDFDAEHILFLKGKRMDTQQVSEEDVKRIDDANHHRLFPLEWKNLLSHGHDKVTYSRHRNRAEEDDDAGVAEDDASSISDYSVSPVPMDSDDGYTDSEWDFDDVETPTPPPSRFTYDLDVIQQYELLTRGAQWGGYFDRDEIIYNQKRDPYLRIVINFLESQLPSRSRNVGDWKTRWKQLTPKLKRDLKERRYYLDGDCLMFQHRNGRRLIVLSPEHRKCYLEYFHHNMVPAVHASAKRMAKELIRHYYWPGYIKDIEDFVRGCICCQMNKGRSNPYGLMKLFTPIRPGQMISIDNKGPIEPATSRGNLYITSIIDRFSGKVWAYPVKAIDAISCSRILMRWIAEEGVPQHLLSDHGGDFISKLVKKLMKLCGIKQLFSTSYHPECNGSIERWHRTMGEMMKCIATEYGQDFSDGDDWDSYIPLVVASHNNTYSERIKMSPNEAYSGRKIRLPVDANVDILNLKDHDDMRRSAVLCYNDWIKTMRDMSIKAASLELEKYDRYRKEYYERIHKPPHWRRGQKVFHWAGPKYSTGLMMGTFKSNWSGPYKIVRELHDGASYELRDVDGSTFKAPLHRLRPCHERDLPGYGDKRPRRRNIELSSHGSHSGDYGHDDDHDDNLMDPDEPLIIHEDHMNMDDEYDAQDGVDSSDMNGMDENDRADVQHVDHPDGTDVAEDADDNAVVSDLTPIGSLSNDPVNNMEEPTLSPKHKRFRDDFSVIGMSDDSESEDEDKPKDDGGMRMKNVRSQQSKPLVHRPTDGVKRTLSDIAEGSHEDSGSGPVSIADAARANKEAQIRAIEQGRKPQELTSVTRNAQPSSNDARLSGQKRRRGASGDDPGPPSKRNRFKLLQSLERKALWELREVRREMNALWIMNEKMSPTDQDMHKFRIVHDRGGTTHLFGRL